MIELGGIILSGISNYFSKRQDIAKLKVEQEKEVIVAETKSKVARLERESAQDFDLNRYALESMRTSWKDEFVLIIITIPFIMLFIPTYQSYAISGLQAMDSSTPIWYQILVLAIFLSIYGLRDILKIVIQLILNRFSNGKV